MTRSPQNIAIENRQAVHAIVWTTEPWLFRRLLFLTHPSNRGGCVWCGNIANVVEHDDWDAYRHGLEYYLDFFRCGAVPMCSPCNHAKRRGKTLCPRCRRQGHYCYPGEVCYDCTPKEVIEERVFKKEHWRRVRTEIDRDRYRQAKQWRKDHVKKSE